MGPVGAPRAEREGADVGAQGKSCRGAASKQHNRKALGEAVGRAHTRSSQKLSTVPTLHHNASPHPATRSASRQPVSDLRRPEQAKPTATAMVHRGRAVVIKKDKYKDVWVDSDGDEVSPPSSQEEERENRNLPRLRRSKTRCLL
jgi:hypothetical protein